MSVTVTLLIGGQPLEAVIDDNALASIALALPRKPIVVESSPFLSVAEAAEFLRARPQRIYDLCSQRRLTRHKAGSRTLIDRAELEQFVSVERRNG